RTYRVGHHTAVPTDTALCVVISPTLLAPISDDADGGHRGVGRTFAETFAETFAAPRTGSIARIQTDLVREAAGGLPAGRLMIDGLAMELMAELARTGPEGRDRLPARAAPGSDTRDQVGAARAFLDDHLAEDVDLAALGRHVALSPFHLARCFRREFGLG